MPFNGDPRGGGGESSLSTPSPLSSHHSSQDSLHKSVINQPKKKGIKSSLGRFFSKKDKVSFSGFYHWWWTWICIHYSCYFYILTLNNWENVFPIYIFITITAGEGERGTSTAPQSRRAQFFRDLQRWRHWVIWFSVSGGTWTEERLW